VERLREIRHAYLAARETRDDAPPGRIGERGEGEIEGCRHGGTNIQPYG
jgi:hypothetical protein